MVLLLGTVVLAQNVKNQFDHVNIETVLSNDRVLTNYIKCLLDKGACTREGRELKSMYSCRLFKKTFNIRIIIIWNGLSETKKCKFCFETQSAN